MIDQNLSVFCADIGSVAAKRFGWAGHLADGQEVVGSSIEDFAESIAQELSSEHKVALGFECPLFVPVRDDPVSVNSSRKGEGNRSWSAGAGTGALATGLVEALWVMRRLNALLKSPPPVVFGWSDFQSSDAVFLWEAFVTSTAKGAGHSDDARIAVQAFLESLPDPESANAIQEDNVLSLVGAAAIRAGWSSSLSILSTPCLVIKA